LSERIKMDEENLENSLKSLNYDYQNQLLHSKENSMKEDSDNLGFYISTDNSETFPNNSNFLSND